MPNAHAPFHISIVSAIDSANSLLELDVLARLVKATTVIANHEDIISAIEDRREALGCEADYSELFVDLRKQAESKDPLSGFGNAAAGPGASGEDS